MVQFLSIIFFLGFLQFLGVFLKLPFFLCHSVLRWIFRNLDVGVWTGSSWLRIGQMAGTCECGNEPSDSIKCGEFLD